MVSGPPDIPHNMGRLIGVSNGGEVRTPGACRFRSACGLRRRTWRGSTGFSPPRRLCIWSMASSSSGWKRRF
jgi:hypothetical protein